VTKQLKKPWKSGTLRDIWHSGKYQPGAGQLFWDPVFKSYSVYPRMSGVWSNMNEAESPQSDHQAMGKKGDRQKSCGIRKVKSFYIPSPVPWLARRRRKKGEWRLAGCKAE
jgi:hypothetical protein